MADAIRNVCATPEGGKFSDLTSARLPRFASEIELHRNVVPLLPWPTGPLILPCHDLELQMSNDPIGTALITFFVVITMPISKTPISEMAQSLAPAKHAIEVSMQSKEQRNSRTILQIFRTIEQRDDVGFRALLQSDFEIHWPKSLPYGGTFRGLEPRPNSWDATWQPLQPTEAERKMDPRIIAAHHDDVVVYWHQRGLSPKGTRFDGDVVGLYTFRQGKLARAQMFYFDTAAVSSFLAEARR